MELKYFRDRNRTSDFFESREPVSLENATIAEIRQRKQERIAELKAKIARFSIALRESEEELKQWESV